jgi:uncharacterized membrane protein
VKEHKTDVMAGLGISLSLAFPALVYFGRDYLTPQVLAVVLLLLVWARRRSAFAGQTAPWFLAGGLLLAMLGLVSNDSLPLKLYPVVFNASLLTVFLLSLRYPPSIAERFARVRFPNPPVPVVAYTRRVTQAWCVFFAGNALIALWTTLWCPEYVWFYYNGVIAYILAGGMFVGEWLLRRRMFEGDVSST